jgi:hypothetical protein
MSIVNNSYDAYPLGVWIFGFRRFDSINDSVVGDSIQGQFLFFGTIRFDSVNHDSIQ